MKPSDLEPTHCETFVITFAYTLSANYGYSQHIYKGKVIKCF